MDPFTLAGIGMGLAGGIGLLTGDSPEAPQLSDIDLARDNPELFQELQRLRRLVQQSEAMYNARRAGMSRSEQLDMERQLGGVNERLASQGLLGSSVGASQRAEAEQAMRDALARRVFDESQALYGNMSNMASNAFNATRQGLGDVMNARLAQYQQDMANQTARNQFFSGLMGSGLNLAGTGMYINRMNELGRLGSNTMTPMFASPQSFAMPQYSVGLPMAGVTPYGMGR